MTEAARDMHKPDMPYDPRSRARALYWCGWNIIDIAQELAIPRPTIQSWKGRDRWDEASPVVKAAECTFTRYMQLIMKEIYTPANVRDIDLLGRQIERFAKIRRFQEKDGHTGDLNDKIANRNAGPKKKPKQNLIDREAAQKLNEAFGRGLYDFQENWKNSTHLRTRMILKSRQIGATFYFARERLIRALAEGNNQVFISASRAQANIFRDYIVDFVFSVTGLQLTGDPIKIERGVDEEGKDLAPVTLYFLGTNYRTAQSYHGDVIIDECFWIHGFEDIFKVSSAIATHKNYTRTLFSTPSTLAHEAYPMWSGERFNRKRRKEDQVKINISHAALKDGFLGSDGIYRQIITIEDALASGFDLVDVEELRLDYSVDEFDNLFQCQFVDDSQSSFPLSLLSPCMVDSWEVWNDFRPYAVRPYAGEVWIGYDPNNNDGAGDPAGLVAVAAPGDSKGKFRVLEAVKLHGLDFEQQDKEIRKFARKYNVTEIAIDTKGVGAAVFQKVITWFSLARKIEYSPAVKGMMVAKAQNVMRNRRLEFDQGTGRALASALMSIHPQVTQGGKFISYQSRRSAENGHGDIGWALLNALYCEPIENTDGESVKKAKVYIQK